jgi:hypothetical protein
MVPAWSHKPNDAGSSPAPATKILKWRKDQEALVEGRRDVWL